jgi:3'-phosphoadenosine 5'-phosphosulfate (PAPS) 3'-phosphatase
LRLEKRTALARQVGKLLALLALAMARAAGAGAGDQRVGLRDLLSASRGLVAEACDIIRSVQREREDAGAAGRQKIQAELKDPSDDRTYLTIADTRAQRHILAGLRARFGTALDIVGEEEEAAAAEGEGACAPGPARAADSAAGTELDPSYIIPPECAELLLQDVTVFVDPVDGTREFVV